MNTPKLPVLVKAGCAEYEVATSSNCDDPACSCGPMTFKTPEDLLGFLRDRFNMGGISDQVAKSYARDIDATLGSTQTL